MRVHILGKLVWGMLGVASVGCVGAEPTVDEDVGVSQQPLYQRGIAFTGGSVHVCFANGTTALREKVRLYANNSWAKAANITFWGWDDGCNQHLAESVVRISFFNNTNGSTSLPGAIPHLINSNGTFTGFTDVSLIANDTDPLERHFRYEVLHELGHALGFAHEQERPDNWDAFGNAIYCDQVQDDRKAIPGGTYRTSFFDEGSVMSYCTGYKTFLSPGDILGAINTYGRRTASHGFMIKSDANSGLALKGGPQGTQVTLSAACTKTNPDCTWQYRGGMLFSDRDPSLAIRVSDVPATGAALRMSNTCLLTGHLQCKWSYSKGQFTQSAFSMHAKDGAHDGGVLQLHSGCDSTNTDCTFAVPNVMLSSVENTALKWHASAGGQHGSQIKLHKDCSTNNPDCTWTFRRGKLFSDSSAAVSVHATSGGGTNLSTLQLHDDCTFNNPDCTWTWRDGMLRSDRNTNMGVHAKNGATHGAALEIRQDCAADDPNCAFFGIYAKD
jgi:hypothetical protein